MRYLMFLLITLSACSRIVIQEHAAQDYYPISKGSKWQYKTTSTIATDKDYKHERPLVIKVEDVINKKDGTYVILESTNTGDIVLVNKKGFFRFTSGGNVCKPPIQILPSSLKTGDSWKNNYVMELSLANIEINESASLTFEKVKVPAGEYDTVRVTRNVFFTLLFRKKHQEFITWYAPNVGMVKEQFNDNNEVFSVTELEKYEPASTE